VLLRTTFASEPGPRPQRRSSGGAQSARRAHPVANLSPESRLPPTRTAAHQFAPEGARTGRRHATPPPPRLAQRCHPSAPASSPDAPPDLTTSLEDPLPNKALPRLAGVRSRAAPLHRSVMGAFGDEPFRSANPAVCLASSARVCGDRDRHFEPAAGPRTGGDRGVVSAGDGAGDREAETDTVG